MPMEQSSLRAKNYPPSVRPARINSTQGAELFMTVRTRNCSYGKCDFCGLKLLDGKAPAPLGVFEAGEQMKNFFADFRRSGENPKSILKASAIGMTDSLLNPKTIKPEALKEVFRIARTQLPKVKEVSVESRLDMVSAPALESLKYFFSDVFGSGATRELDAGVETANERVRNGVGKGISDKLIYDVSRTLAEIEWNFRAYFIYNLLERENNRGSLISAVDFMARLRDETKVNPSILILRGYVPEGFEKRELFRGFSEVKDEIALSELRAAAIHAKQQGIKFEIDSTSEDQSASGAGVLSREYTAALVKYNLTLDPDNLVLNSGSGGQSSTYAYFSNKKKSRQ
jgi:uncharacterized Fe-S cluster-containing MiaB family protein